jgi:hypothetical protein
LAAPMEQPKRKPSVAAYEKGRSNLPKIQAIANKSNPYKSRDTLVEPYWEQQPWENDQQYARFCVYRNLPPHTKNRLAEAALEIGVQPNSIKSIAHRDKWVTRAKAYAQRLDKLRMLSDEQAAQGVRVQQYEAFAEVVDRLKVYLKDAPMADMKFDEAVRALDTATKNVRQAMGLRNDEESGKGQQNTITLVYQNDEWRGARVPVLDGDGTILPLLPPSGGVVDGEFEALDEGRNKQGEQE